MSWSEADSAWSGLSSAERRDIAMAGRGFGSLDFVSPTVRYAINRELVREEWQRLNGLSHLTGSERQRYDLYERLLREHQQILFFDPTGDGRIGVVHGDLLHASEIAVQVPGIDNRLDNYWTLLDESQRLHGAAGSTDVAVVSWLGYDTPGLSGEALIDGFAQAGKTSLVSMVSSIDAARPDARITVIGHSYGSLVTGLAARAGMPADQVVLIGSPGVGVDSVDAFVRDDGTRPVVLVGENVTDYVAAGSDIGNPDPSGGYFGVNPSSPHFNADGVRWFGEARDLDDFHSYYGTGSEQLRWLGEIIRPPTDLAAADRV